MPLFTPNGDGYTDTFNLTYTTNKETFVDWQVTNAGGTVVRSFSSWTQGGSGSATWDGKKDDGTYVTDGTYTVTGTPSSRAGNYGDAAKRQRQGPDHDGIADGELPASSTPRTATASQRRRR